MTEPSAARGAARRPSSPLQGRARNALPVGAVVLSLAFGPVVNAQVPPSVTPASAASTSLEPSAGSTSSPTLKSAVAPGPSERAAVDRYRALMVEARPSISNLNGFQLRRGGAEVELGFFGGNAAAIFGDSPKAMDAAEAFQTRRMTGTALWATGMATLIVTLILTATESDFIFEKTSNDVVFETKPTFWALLATGGALGVGGAFIMQSSVGPLNDAVDAWNEHAYQRALGGPAGPGLRLGGGF